MESNARRILQRDLGFYKKNGWEVKGTYQEQDHVCAELTHPEAGEEDVLTIFAYEDGERVFRGPWFAVDEVYGRDEPPPAINPSEIPKKNVDTGTIILVVVSAMIMLCLLCVLAVTVGPMAWSTIQKAISVLQGCAPLPMA